MNKIKWIESPLFSSAWFAFIPSKDDWDKLRADTLKKHPIDIGEYPSITGCCTNWHQNEDAYSAVTLNEHLDKDPVRLVATLAHEAYHVACLIFDEAREDAPGEETVATMVGKITEILWLEYVRTRAKQSFLAKA